MSNKFRDTELVAIEDSIMSVIRPIAEELSDVLGEFIDNLILDEEVE